MAKSQNSSLADLYLNGIRTATTFVNVNSTQPTTYPQAITTYMLATIAVDSSDWTLAAGDAGGNTRKITFVQQTDVPMTNAGTALHVSMTDGSNLLFVNTTPSKALSGSPDTVTIQAFKIEVGDPT